MLKRAPTAILLTGSLFLPGIIAWIFVQTIYSLGLVDSLQAWFYPTILLGVILGAWSLVSLPIKNSLIKVALAVAYVPSMLVTAWYVGMMATHHAI